MGVPVDKPAQSLSAVLLRLALEVGPLAVFFIANTQTGNIFVGTGAFMAAIVVSLILSRLIEKRFPVMPLVTAVFVLVFGGLTLLLEDALFIQIKPTLVNTLFGLILLAGLATGRPLLKPLLGSAMELDERGWKLLTLRWALFFFFLAGLNEVLRRAVSPGTWVSMKLFLIVPLTLIFAFAQAPLVRRHSPRPTDAPQP